MWQVGCYATGHEIPAPENTRNRRLLLRRVARDVGRRVDAGQALICGDGRARIPGSGRRENRVERIKRDTAGCGRLLARENPSDSFCPVGQPPRLFRSRLYSWHGGRRPLANCASSVRNAMLLSPSARAKASDKLSDGCRSMPRLAMTARIIFPVSAAACSAEGLCAAVIAAS
jgi:hypothetical protein